MSKKTVQILVEITINDSLIDVTEWEVERTLNSALHIGLDSNGMHDIVKEDICDNVVHFKTKIVMV